MIGSFFSSGTWLVVRNLLIFFAAVFWIAFAYWVYKDARRRIEDPWLVGMATLLGLVPPYVGPFIYMLFRPPEYLEDVRERELEIRSMEDRLSKRDLHCPVCRSEVDSSFLVCPICTTKLKQACVKCKSPLEALWQICPFCETPVAPTVVTGGLLQPPAPPPAARHRPEAGAGGLHSSAVALERTLILIKPDAVRRRLAAEILGRIEARGFEIRAGKLLTASRELGETHYAEHREKPFFPELVAFITSGPTWALVVQGEGAIATMRKTIGATNPANAEPGTIRGDLAMSMPDNLVHGSDSPESAEREVALWFSADELV